MIKIGITGSISSGKTTASKIISKENGPLFVADDVVRKFYTKKNFRKLLANKLNIVLDKKFKEQIKKKIFESKSTLKDLEKIIHPLVRKEMFKFIKKNKKKKIVFFEIPLLVENKLGRIFDVIIFIKTKKPLRRKRYLLKGGSKKLFLLLNNHQLTDKKKTKYCDYVVVNNASLSVLKKKLLIIIKKYV